MLLFHITTDNGISYFIFDNFQPLASELINIRMKLEESRRKIEDGKKKMEQQMSEQRQKMGKQAFMHVINKASNCSSNSKESKGKKCIMT